MTQNDIEGSPAEVDFTIARGISSDHLLKSLQKFFADQHCDIITVDRTELNKSATGENMLSKSDAECFFTGLALNGAAKQTGTAATFADYQFTVDTDRAVQVLREQRNAKAALEEVGALSTESADPQIELTGTFPPGLSSDDHSGVRPLSADLRRMFFDAETIVRVANPYFDPSPSIVGDIASMAGRGVETKILTRETESASQKLKTALNAVFEQIEPEDRHRLQVRDLYKEDDQTGHQAHATHAKIAIADQDVCYLGSANLTDTSLSSNFELGVLMRNKKTVGTAIDVFDAVFEFSRPVDLPL